MVAGVVCVLAAAGQSGQAAVEQVTQTLVLDGTRVRTVAPWTGSSDTKPVPTRAFSVIWEN